MRHRAIAIGLFGVVFVSAVTFFNDKVIDSTNLIGHYVPVAVFGPLLVMSLLWFGVLRRDGTFLTGRDLSVAAALMLFICFIPGRGMMHYFGNVLNIAHHYQRVRPSWRGSTAELSAEEIMDWPRLRESLARSGHPLHPQTWVELQRRLRSVPGMAGSSAQSGVSSPADDSDQILAALNRLIRDPGFPGGAADLRQVRLPRYLSLLLDQDVRHLTPDQVSRRNRGVLEILLDPVLAAQRPGPLASVPPCMRTQPADNSEDVVDAYMTGLAKGDRPVRLADIPWQAWWRPLLFWGALVLALSATVTGLVLMVHRQWSANERLPYPTIEFARALLPDKGTGLPRLFRERWFWIALGIAFTIHMNNYACRWWPRLLLRIPLSFDLRPLLKVFPVYRAGIGARLFSPRLVFAAVGFAFLLPREAALSIGLAPWVYWLAVGVLAHYGVQMGGGVAFFSPHPQAFAFAGGYVGLFVILAYAGRRHYSSVLRRSLGLRSGDAATAAEVGGGRLLLGGALAFVLLLVAAGLEWWLAALYLGLTLVIYTVAARLVAEAGVIFLQAYWYAGDLLWGVCGACALGPDSILIMGILSSVLLISARECMMGFAIAAVRLADVPGGAPGRFATWAMTGVLLSLLVAVPVSLYLQYSLGAPRTGDRYTTDFVPTAPYENDIALRMQLQAQGTLRDATRNTGSARLVSVRPDPACLTAFAVTFCGVLAMTLLRHRFPKWPVHPLLFTVLGTWQAISLAASFLAGFLIKSLAVRYGGGPGGGRVKPFMIGLVAGDFLAALAVFLIGALYYFITGNRPVRFPIFPG